MATKGTGPDPLYKEYIKQKNKAWKEQGIRLTDKEFLSTIDPHKTYTDANARHYMNQLREGKWSSNLVMQRSRSTGGQIYNVLLKDSRGVIVDSVMIEFSVQRNLHDEFVNGNLEKYVEKALEHRYRSLTKAAKGPKSKIIRRRKMDDYEFEDEVDAVETPYGIESLGHETMDGLAIAGVQPAVNTRNRFVQTLGR